MSVKKLSRILKRCHKCDWLILLVGLKPKSLSFWGEWCSNILYNYGITERLSKVSIFLGTSSIRVDYGVQTVEWHMHELGSLE